MIDSLFMHYYNSKMFEIFLLSFFSPNRIKQLLQMHRLNFVEQDIFCILLNYLTWWNNNWCAAGSLGKAANSFLSRKFPASRTQVLKKQKKKKEFLYFNIFSFRSSEPSKNVVVYF